MSRFLDELEKAVEVLRRPPTEEECHKRIILEECRQEVFEYYSHINRPFTYREVLERLWNLYDEKIKATTE